MNKLYKNSIVRGGFLLGFIVFYAFSLSAQTLKETNFTINIQEVHLIRINPLSEISMRMLASVAGETMIPKTNSTSYLQLTSIGNSQTRKVLVTIQNGSVPTGTLLTLMPSTCMTGAGNRGEITNMITLKNGVNNTLLENIGSGYTGTATNNGFRLNYTWQVDPAKYALLKAISGVRLTIKYTITEN